MLHTTKYHPHLSSTIGVLTVVMGRVSLAGILLCGSG